MAYKTGIARSQINLFPICLDEAITPDNIVRVIDAFVDWLDLEALGFQHATDNIRGTSMYPPDMLLKLYIYGYLNRIRSSRRLALECQRNIELHWLLQRMTPAYHTIADFRKVHPDALKSVFNEFTQFCITLSLVQGEKVAVDGTKIRAQNSSKNNFNTARLEKLLTRLNLKTQEYEQYLKELDDNDTQEAQSSMPNITMGKTKQDILKTLQILEQRRVKYTDFQKQLQDLTAQGCSTEELQISTVDPDARNMSFKRTHTEVGYNVQTVGDDKNKLIIHFEVTNVGDQNALAALCVDTKQVLHLDVQDPLNAIADSGYHGGEQLALCADNGVITFVAPIDYAKSKLPLDHPLSDIQKFTKEHFTYDAQQDVYICPNQQKLSTNGTWYEHKAKRKERPNRQYKQYTLPAKVCEQCPFAERCHKNSTKRPHGRCIERTPYDEAVEANRKRVEQNTNAYQQRKEIIEHPFGTIKRSWGFYYTLLRTKKKVTGEFALIYLCYNLRRVANILGTIGLKKALNSLILCIMTYLVDLRTVLVDKNRITLLNHSAKYQLINA